MLNFGHFSSGRKAKSASEMPTKILGPFWAESCMAKNRPPTVAFWIALLDDEEDEHQTDSGHDCEALHQGLHRITFFVQFGRQVGAGDIEK